MTGDGATCLATRCFCELVRGAGLAQPANAWSSLAFVVAALLAVPLLFKAARPERALVGVLAVALAAVGLSSFTFHARLTLTGQFLDVLSMCAVAMTLAMGALVRLRVARPVRALTAGALLLAALGRVLHAWPDSRRWVFAVALIPGVVLEVRRSRMPLASAQPARWLWVGLGLLSAAYGIWLLDQTGVLCAPSSPLQGHAVWHVLGAAAGWCLARHWAVTGARRPEARAPSRPPGALGSGRARPR